jgi:hypothetical protein
MMGLHRSRDSKRSRIEIPVDDSSSQDTDSDTDSEDLEDSDDSEDSE